MDIVRLVYPCPELEPLLRIFYSEHRTGPVTALPLNEDKARAHINQCLLTGVVYGALQEGGITGSIALIPTATWWSDSEILSDGWFYVHPAHRKGGAAVRLLKEAKRMADALGAPFRIDISHSDDLEAKCGFLQKMGFSQVGASLIYGGNADVRQ